MRSGCFRGLEVGCSARAAGRRGTDIQSKIKVGTFEESRIFKILRFKNIQAVRLKNLEESVWNTSWSLWAHGRKCEAHARTHHKNLTSTVYCPQDSVCTHRTRLARVLIAIPG